MMKLARKVSFKVLCLPMCAVQENSKACICSGIRECLWCLERTAAHTLLSFTNSDKVRHASFVISSRAVFERNGVRRRAMGTGGGEQMRMQKSSSTPVMATEADVSSPSFGSGTARADDSGITQQMRQSRLAQVGR